jgi:two-component system sensor histidine kinase AlgZ
MAQDPRSDELFLPDFCGIRTVFAVVLGGELLACVLVLAQGARGTAGWRDLALVSLFVQWVGLTSAGVLCLARPRLGRLGNTGAGVVAYLFVLLLTAVLSELSLWLVVRPGLDVETLISTLAGRGQRAAPATGHAEFLLRNLGLSAIVAAVALRYFYVQHQWKANLESEARSRVQALQSRIRPHFLFNSMNTIASLTRSDPVLAEQVTEDLADLFRVSLADASVPVLLERELDVCRQYLRIEQLRLGDRVRCIMDVDALPGDARIPGLTLQPLLENAVYHGIEPAPEGGEIVVRGDCDGSRLHIVLENTLPPEGARRVREGHRMAQENVAQRLAAFYAGEASLDAEEDTGRYRLTLDLPYLGADGR